MRIPSPVPSIQIEERDAPRRNGPPQVKKPHRARREALIKQQQQQLVFDSLLTSRFRRRCQSSFPSTLSRYAFVDIDGGRKWHQLLPLSRSLFHAHPHSEMWREVSYRVGCGLHSPHFPHLRCWVVPTDASKMH
jgi:hypothetical protein